MPIDNAARASRALASLRAYAKAARLPHQLTEERIADLVTDLLHLAYRNQATTDAIAQMLRLAHVQFLSERPVALPQTTALTALPYNPTHHGSRMQ